MNRNMSCIDEELVYVQDPAKSSLFMQITQFFQILTFLNLKFNISIKVCSLYKGVAFYLRKIPLKTIKKEIYKTCFLDKYSDPFVA